MRNFKDNKDYEVCVSSISGDNAFSGLLEGTPYMARRVRLRKARRDLEQRKGMYCWGLDELEKELQRLDKDTGIWPDKERWVASVGVSEYLGCENELYKYENKNLRIHWFQEGGDPMEKLKFIVSNIDFLSLCVTEVVEEYD